MSDDTIDIRRPGDKLLICGGCGSERRVPAGDWRAWFREGMTDPDDWDGILRCCNGHEPEPMHAFEGVEHGDSGWRGKCACGHTGAWAEKDAAWADIADHLLPPLQMALLRRLV
jgi:hypothetical protein